MLTTTEIAGFIGVGLAAGAYVPQVWHLIRAHCSAGISRFAFGVWLTASMLLTIRAIAIGAGVFIALGSVQILAITVVLVGATKYAASPCASHRPRGTDAAVAARSTSVGGEVRDPTGRHRTRPSVARRALR